MPSSPSDLVDVAVEEAVCTVTLQRPEKRNALNHDLVAALKRALSAAAEDDAVRVVVLTGAGSTFSAGADLAALKALRDAAPLENQDDSRHLAELFRQIYRHPKPVIAKVNGPAVAGGCGLAAVCDFSIAAAEAKMGFTEVRIGFVPAIVMVFLRRKVGETVARDLLLRGRLVEATDAAAQGLITHAVPADALDEKVAALADELATETSGSAVRLTKQMLAQVPGMGLDEALDYAVQMNAFARGTDDCQAGIQAFLDGEDPPWKQAAQDASS
jgi:methylglutaconyl-CoA hydratase